MPDGNYDFIANIPEGSLDALQKEIQRKFGLVGKRELRRVDVLLLTLKNPNAGGLKPTRGIGIREESILSPGFCSIPNQPLTGLTELLETYFEIPVLDRSKQAARFDIQIQWDEQEARKNPAGLKKALSDELGIELISSEESVEMLIVSKIK